MEEMNNPPQTAGSGQPQQHPVNHTRPFFYVQPSQPYFMYPWQMNNPYGHYGFPGSGLPFGRPYMAPYAYMQYPGYVIPYAPVQPMDYRRMFNPCVPSAAACEARFRNGQIRVRRETACSEAQTEPSDALNSLIETLDKFVTREVVNPRKEVPSGISQDSGIGLPEYGQKCDKEEVQPKPASMAAADIPFPTPVVPPGDSCTAAYKEELARKEYPVTEKVQSLDSSSVYEEVGLKSTRTERQGNIQLEQQVPCGVESLLDMAPEQVVQNCEQSMNQRAGLAEPSTHHLPDKVAELGNETSEVPLVASATGGSNVCDMPPVDFEDLPYRILRLPYDTVSPVGPLQKHSPLWCVDHLSSLVPPASYLSSFGNGCYSYYPQMVQERQSVLSPSLDELSSRDEMFSTDMEDMDVIPGHVYMGTERLVGGTDEARDPNGDVKLQSFSSSEECSVCSRKTCATCGSTLSKKAKWNKVHSPEVCNPQEEAMEEAFGEDYDDFEMDRNACELQEALLKKQPYQKRPIQPHCGQQASRQRSKKGHFEKLRAPVCLEALDQECKSPETCCEEHMVMTRGEKYKGKELQDPHCRPTSDGQQKEGAVASDQESWESCCVKGRAKSLKRNPSSRGQERPTRKKTSCKTFRPLSSRRNDHDDKGGFPCSHRGRGMSATPQSPGTGPHGLNASDRPPGSPGGTNSARGSCQARSESHSHPHHPRPFFYVQPSQPHVPYQWHMPMQYGPYYGFPGFGYGVVMPASPYGFPPNPYLETPGYVVPHTQLHLTDYRRMLNPHFTPTMAYHTRRFRYQHVTAPRETTSSEVQTDPLPQGTRDPWLSGTSESRVRSAQSTGSDSGQGSSSISTSLFLEASPQPGGADGPSDPDVGVMPTPPQATATPKGACVFQREEMRIECGGALSGVKIIRSHETTADSTQDAPGNLAQCDVWSVSSAEGIIPLYHPPLTEGTAITQDTVCLTEQLEQQPSMPAYPDILLVGGSSSSGTEKPEVPCMEECNAPARKTASDPVTGVVQVCRELGNNNASSLKEACFKILRLPFEMCYLEELQKVESSVWSVEPLVPYMPLVDSKVQHNLEDEKVTENHAPIKNEEAGEVPMETSISQAPVTSSKSDCEDSTSVPPYLPSGSWLADFGNVYYYSKLPPSVHAHLSGFGASTEQLRDKLSQDSEGQAVVTVTGRMAENHTDLLGLDGKRHFYPKDHLNLPPATKSFISSDERRRSCSRCAKRSTPCGLLPKVLGVKRHRTALPAPTDMKLLSRVTCRCCSGKFLRKGSGSSVLDSQDGGEEMEYEVEQNGAHPGMPKQQSCEAKRPAEGGGPKCTKRHFEKCSVKCTKLREKNCACKDSGDAGIYGGLSRRCIGMVGVCNENVVVSSPIPDKRKTPEQRSNSTRCPMEKSWQGTVPVPGKGGLENGNRLKNHSKQRKQYALSQERLHLKTFGKVSAQQLEKNDTDSPVEGFFNQPIWTKHGTNQDTRY